MAKKNQRNNPNPEKINQQFEKAKEQLNDEDLNHINNSTSGQTVSLEELWKKSQIFETAMQKLETTKQEIERHKTELETKIQEMEQQKENLAQETQNLNQKQEQLQQLEAELTQKAATLNQKERDLYKRELNAEAGFIAESQAAFAPLEKQRQALREEHDRSHQRIAEERKALEEKNLRQQSELEHETVRKQQELEADFNQLKEERKKIKRQQRDLQLERELLEDEKHLLEEKIEQKVAVQVQNLEVKLQVLNQRLETENKLRNQFQECLVKKAEADRRFGQKTPEQVLEELQDLRQTKEKLEQQLAASPNPGIVDKLKELESQQENWENERSRLTTQLQELKRSNTYNRIAVTELETLRDEKESLEASNNRLKNAIGDLKEDFNQAFEQSQDKSPFPDCFRMDSDTTLQARRSLFEDILNLQKFAKDLRYRIAVSPRENDKKLYYSERDIRVFLGGLAMSRLHLLQGISGTGKTSLAVAFAKAVDGQSKLIEVQAGWRDRQDLLGYFNAFEKKFYESEFLQALYEAQCPAYQDRIYVIVLDEMNLSRPEQYFADFLSKLEQETPSIALTSVPDRPNPQLFENGKTLKIPSNIWFIGTANQDETTLEFADKTYDRAHVMELQRHPDHFDVPTMEFRDPVSYTALMKAFKQAQMQHSSEAKNAYEFLNVVLADTLEKQFKVGWGNRLERQMKDFVPVVVAAGGTTGEAVDHILATKILRKVRDRYDTLANHIRQLKEDILNNWSALDAKTQPEQSLAILDAEIHRLEPGGEN
ncbi:hypothetical protein [Lyngbya sp. CCY1209]|uniref:hypothetical protein n=1 Tax=Lyngbya sp. CCY1209 TaxID=2886103 RepID=UPI002D20AB91|nr:hypothetical protein [Lyngbya sp. CCY1209]MEB3882006.1 hypothetical protein [Lyngbya sp. CCY1209]